MIVANATFEARTSFGVGDFAYSALDLDGRFSAPWFSVLSHRAYASAPTFSLPVSTADLQDGVRLSIRDVAKHITTSVEDFSSLRQGGVLLRIAAELDAAANGDFSSITSLSSSRHTFRAGFVSSSLFCLSVDKRNFGGGLVLFAKSGDFVGDALSAAITCRCEAGHYLTGACTLTVTAPWFHTHARSSYTIYSSPCRREARRGFASACTLPKFGRSLRL